MKLIYIIFVIVVFIIGLVIGRSVKPGTAIAAFKTELPEFTIENCVSSFSDDKAEPTAKGFLYWFVKKEFSGALNVKMSSVSAKSANHPPHVHDEAEVFYILNGKARFYLKEDSTIVGAQTTLFCPSGVPHGISNAGDTALQYLVIKNN